MIKLFHSCGYAGDVVSIQSRSSDDNILLPLHVHGVNTQTKHHALSGFAFSNVAIFKLCPFVLSCSLFGGYFAGNFTALLKATDGRKALSV